MRREFNLFTTLKTGNPILVRNEWEWKIPFSSLLYCLVRLLTGCRYNHIVMAWNTGAGVVIVESNGKGVVATDLSVWLSRRKRTLKVIDWECKPENFVKHLGKRYDKASFLYYYLYFMIFKKWTGKNDLQAQDMFTCSELVATAHQLPGPWLWLPKDFEKYAAITA